jgi:hypothetical protein
MKKLLIVAVILVVGWQYLQQRTNLGEVEVPSDWNQKLLDQPGASQSSSRFSCDGRTHCSQMTSCEEATFFIQNCPGTEMDGDGDGVPCESQWCGR